MLIENSKIKGLMISFNKFNIKKKPNHSYKSINNHTNLLN